MASEQATPPALRWVALFLAVCAALGLWLGFKDQIRRNPPDWYTGAAPPAAGVTTGGAEIREATAFDPAAKDASTPAAATQPVKTEDKDEATGDNAPAATQPPDGPPTPTPAAATPPRPKTAPSPAPRPAPAEDPVGDILDGQRPDSDTPPNLPY